MTTGPTLNTFLPNPFSNCSTDVPRILFLIDEMTSITAGGTERQLLQLVEISIKSGLAPQICVLRGTDWLTPQIAGCPVKHFHITSSKSIHGIRSFLQLGRWMRQQRFDIMQAFFPEANFFGPWIARLADVPIVLGARRNLNYRSPGDPDKVGDGLQRISNLLVDQVVANSAAVLERVIEKEHLPRRKICVVYNGIDTHRVRPVNGMRAMTRGRLGITNDQILVGNVSGLRQVKGVECFVEAAAIAHRRHPQLRFVLIGEGPLRATLERMIAEHNLKNVLFLTGPADDIRPYLAAMDIAVLCSFAEGFSNSLLEYMVAGLPTVASDVGGNREALAGAGLLIPSRDAERLADALSSLLDPAARDHYSAAARRAVKRFDVTVAEQRIGDLLWMHLRTNRKTRARFPRPANHVQKFSPKPAKVVTLHREPLETCDFASAGDVHSA